MVLDSRSRGSNRRRPAHSGQDEQSQQLNEMAAISTYQSMKDLPATAAAGELVAVVRIASGKGERSRAALFVYIPHRAGWCAARQSKMSRSDGLLTVNTYPTTNQLREVSQRRVYGGKGTVRNDNAQPRIPPGGFAFEESWPRCGGRCGAWRAVKKRLVEREAWLTFICG